MWPCAGGSDPPRRRDLDGLGGPDLGSTGPCPDRDQRDIYRAQLGLPCMKPAPLVASDLLANPLDGAPVGGRLQTRRCSVTVGASWAHGS
jgi:hypothetical protein